MKKLILIIIVSLFLVPYTPVKAETITKNDIHMRDDLIFIMLYPSIQQELKKQYGEIKQNYCGKITHICQWRPFKCSSISSAYGWNDVSISINSIPWERWLL